YGLTTGPDFVHDTHGPHRILIQEFNGFWTARRVTGNNQDPSLRIASWSGRQILASVSKNARHPDKLVQEFLYATAVTRIGDLSGLIKKLSCIAEIDVPENRDQAELTQHRNQTLDHSRTAERTS